MLERTQLPPSSFKEFANWILMYPGLAEDLLIWHRRQQTDKEILSGIHRFFRALTELDFAQIASSGELPSERVIELANLSALSSLESSLPFELYNVALSLKQFPRGDRTYFTREEIEDEAGDLLNRRYIIIDGGAEVICEWSENCGGCALSFLTDDWAEAVRCYLIDKGRVFDSYKSLAQFAKENDWPNWQLAETQMN